MAIDAWILCTRASSALLHSFAGSVQVLTDQTFLILHSPAKDGRLNMQTVKVVNMAESKPTETL